MIRKIIFAVRAKPGLTRQEALAHLHDRHAPLVAASATMRSRLKTYIQNHAVDGLGIDGLAQDRDWIVESWADSSVKLPDPPTAADAILVREDEARFPDRASLLVLAVDEKPVWRSNSNNGAAPCPVKVFGYLKRRSSIQAETFDAAWAQAAKTLADTPAFQRWVRASSRNLSRPGLAGQIRANGAPTPGLVPPYDGVDVWRFESAEDVRAFLTDEEVRDALNTYLGTIAEPGSVLRYATQEHVIFDDAAVASTPG